MDVNSLYASIPHSDEVETCRSFLTISTTDQALINDTPTLVDFILKHNLFVFDDEQYLQINGTAIGTKMVPIYANIFMYYVENTFLSSFNLQPTGIKQTKYFDLPCSHKEKKTIDNHIPIVQIYHPTIVSTNKSVTKEWKLYSNINSAKHLFCNSPVCAYRQPPNLKRILIKSNISRIPTLVGNSKCMKPRCQVCDMLDTHKKLQMPSISSTIQPGKYYCDSCNIVHLLMCNKCDSGNYIGEASNRIRFRLNNHKKSIRNNSKGFPVVVHFNQPDHSLKNLRCIILRGDFKATADRLIREQTFIHKLKTHSKGVNQDLSFLSPYSYFHLLDPNGSCLFAANFHSKLSLLVKHHILVIDEAI